MKTGKIIIYIAALMGATVSGTLWVGCKSGGTSPPHPLGQASSPVKPNDTTWEYKTVERTVSADPQKAAGELKQQMQEFAQEGWLVLSSSKPLPQPDGTIQRKFELKRPTK